MGLGSYEHKAAYTQIEGNGAANRISPDGQNIANIVTLDSYVAEHKLSRVDFIKLDVEGAELDVLRGATNSIATWKPKLAISAYHKLDDLWVLTKFIKSVRADYEFALRHWPTSTEDDTYLLTNDRISTLEKFNLDTRCPTFFECVLMCR